MELVIDMRDEAAAESSDAGRRAAFRPERAEMDASTSSDGRVCANEVTVLARNARLTASRFP